jgi:hypothetical protein
MGEQAPRRIYGVNGCSLPRNSCRRHGKKAAPRIGGPRREYKTLRTRLTVRDDHAHNKSAVESLAAKTPTRVRHADTAMATASARRKHLAPIEIASFEC